MGKMHVNKCGGVGYRNLKLIKGMYVKECANCPILLCAQSYQTKFCCVNTKWQ